MKIAYQGIPGCYSEQAIHTFFGDNANPISMTSFLDIFKALIDEKCELGLIPIENCLGGSIHENYDMLSKYDVIIQAEYNLKISHCLVALPGSSISDIKRVVSHSQALRQCESNLELHNFTSEALYDTAASAKYIRDNQLTDTAAISSRVAAKKYDLDVLREDFQDSDQCYTRFLLIRKATNDFIAKCNRFQLNKIRHIGLNNYMELPYKWTSEMVKTSIVLSLNDSVGALGKILNIFSLYNINLTKIESRPILASESTNQIDSFSINSQRNASDKVSDRNNDREMYMDMDRDTNTDMDRGNGSNNSNNSNDTNIKKVENEPFQYRFYLDFIIEYDKIKQLEKVFNILTDQVNYLKILGSYEQNNKLYSANKRLHIGIVGFGRFGQFMARKLSMYHKVSASSRSDYSDLAGEMQIDFYSNLDSLLEKNLDVILISSSIVSFKGVLTNIVESPNLNNCLIVDVLSVKEHPKSLMHELVPANCDILATHPMFGPDSCPTDNWDGQTFVYEKVRITDYERYSSFMDTFAETKLIEMPCYQHDILASKSQFVSHLVGRLLSLMEVESTPIDTTSYQMLLKLKRIMENDSQDLFKGLYQFNSFSREQFKKLMEKVEEMNDLLRN